MTYTRAAAERAMKVQEVIFVQASSKSTPEKPSAAGQEAPSRMLRLSPIAAKITH
jgi:hypothetical protein